MQRKSFAVNKEKMLKICLLILTKCGWTINNVPYCLGQFGCLIIIIIFLFSCIFIFLSRESDQCAIRAPLGVAGHVSITPRWENHAKCLSQRHNK